MSKYEEDAYGRAEMKFSTLERQIQWLSSFAQKGGNGYEQAAVSVATQLAAAKGIRQKATSLKSVESLQDLKSEAQDIGISKVKKETLSIIDNRIEVASRIQRESKLAREGETEKKLRSEIKQSKSEFEFASILRKAEEEVSDSAYNRLNNEVDKRLKEIRKEKADEEQKQREENARQRRIEEQLQREKEKEADIQRELRRKIEAEELRREGVRLAEIRKAQEIAERQLDKNE